MVFTFIEFMAKQTANNIPCRSVFFSRYWA